MHTKALMKKNIITTLCMVSIWLSITVQPLAASGQDPKTTPRLKGKKVALVIPYGRYNRYMHEEFMGAFESHGIKVAIVSSQLGNATPNKGTIEVAVEKTIEQVDMNYYDALLFSGGGSLYTEFANNPKTTQIINKAVQLNKVVAGIDLGKAVLVNAGIVDYQIPKNRDTIGAAVTVKGKVITGNSTYVIVPFIEAVLEAM